MDDGSNGEQERRERDRFLGLVHSYCRPGIEKSLNAAERSSDYEQTRGIIGGRDDGQVVFPAPGTSGTAGEATVSVSCPRSGSQGEIPIRAATADEMA